MLSFGTENCTHLKCNSGSHYTKGSFVSPLFAILHWCVTCYLVSLGHHLHVCEKGRKWDLYNMDAQNKYIQQKDVHVYTQKFLCTYSRKACDLTCLYVSSLTPLILYIRPYSVSFHLKHCHFKTWSCCARQVCSVASKCATVTHSVTPSSFIYPFLHWDIQVFSFFSTVMNSAMTNILTLVSTLPMGKLAGYMHQGEN